VAEEFSDNQQMADCFLLLSPDYSEKSGLQGLPAVIPLGGG